MSQSLSQAHYVFSNSASFMPVWVLDLIKWRQFNKHFLEGSLRLYFSASVL